MYPDWPEPAADLFRFVDESVWGDEFSQCDLDAPTLSVFADYSEPFNCECRAFGRLQETGNEDLANKCYGYLLLDEEHEKIVMNQFSHPQIEFGGDAEGYGFDDARERFLGKDGWQPPIRVAKKYLRDMIRFQQLGIFNLDPGHQQLVDSKVADFTTAITIPHFITNPELNPNLTPEQISDIEFQVFYLCSGDYWAFDEMIKDWNILHSSKLKELRAYEPHIMTNKNSDERIRYRNIFVWELARYLIGEEIVVYPAMEKHLNDGRDMASKDRDQHQTIKEQLYKFQSLEADDPEFEPTFRSLFSNLQRHVKEEEEHDLPQLESRLDNDSLLKLSKSFERTKFLAPTRSHPSAPNVPPFETAAALLSAPIDKITDIFRKFPKQDGPML
ncbi:hypothetical protein ABKA04_001032 [Annulohypoxylon sp. FPYF3050]